MPQDPLKSQVLDGDWEQTHCPGCKSTQGILVLSLQEKYPVFGMLPIGIRKCKDCELAYLNPRPTPAAIGAYYPQNYDPYLSKTFKPTKSSSKEFSFPPQKVGASLLDFGCGSGAFLAKMQNLGWQVTGLDFSPHAVEQTRSMGIDAYQGGVDHPAISGRLFDVITMRQVLEHLHDPLSALRDVRKIIAPGGMLSVSVPNLDSLAWRLFGDDWFCLDFPRHLSFFSPRSLSGLLVRAGFSPRKVRFIRHAGWMRESAKKAMLAGRAGFWKTLLSTRVGSSLASRWASLTDQCDCIQVLAFPENGSGLSK